MNRAMWESSSDPWAMMAYISACRSAGPSVAEYVSDRRLQLFAAACCWCVRADLGRDAETLIEWNKYPVSDPAAWARCWAGDITTPTPAARASILRDMIGNPFRPVTISPGWLTPDVRRLAGAAWDDRLPDGTLDRGILLAMSDALEEAGCVSDSDEAVDRVYVCEKCGNVQKSDLGDGIFCRSCGSEFCRKQRHRELPHPVIAALRRPGERYRGFWAVELLRDARSKT